MSQVARPRVVFVLPSRESFGPDAAGAVANVVHRLGRATAGAVVLGAPVRGAAFGDIGFAPIGKSRPSQFGYILGVVVAIARLRPAYIDVHQHPRLAWLLAMLFPRCRVMLFIHNDPLAMHGLKSVRQRASLLGRLHRVVLVSDHLLHRYMTGIGGGHRMPAKLANPIDLTEVPAPAPRRKREFLYAGRVNKDKGVDVFIAACARVLPELPDWSARMIGGEWFGFGQRESAPYLALRRAAEAAGIVCTGFLPQPQVMQAMSEAAIVVVPSRWAEPFGLTALEALAGGGALITTEQGGLPEVAGAAAVYVPAGDAAALAEAMLALALDEAERARLGAAGLARARKFDTPLIAATLESLRTGHPTPGF